MNAPVAWRKQPSTFSGILQSHRYGFPRHLCWSRLDKTHHPGKIHHYGTHRSPLKWICAGILLSGFWERLPLCGHAKESGSSE
jgi:hypothetical protein